MLEKVWKFTAIAIGLSALISGADASEQLEALKYNWAQEKVELPTTW